MNRLKLVSIGLYLALLGFPLLNTGLRFIEPTELSGEVRRQAETELSWESFRSGAWQSTAATKLLESSGVRGHFVRTDNQINYSILGQLNNDYHAGSVLGMNGNAFRHSELENFNRLNLVPEEDLVRLAADLRELQELLARRNIAFLLLISPNRLSLYPEIVPRSHSIFARRSRPSNYDRLLPLLEREGVNTFDSVQFLRERKDSTPQGLFGSAGGHYNEYAACLVSSELVRRFELALRRELVEFSCDPPQLADPLGSGSTELVRLANLWYFKYPVTNERLVPTYTISRSEGVFRPSLFVEGSSFMWGINSALDEVGVLRNRDFFYYFNTHSARQRKEKQRIDREAVKWERHVFRHEIFMLEIYEGAVEETGHGIIHKALEQLSGVERDPAPARVGKSRPARR